jgi:hypothetical protein
MIVSSYDYVLVEFVDNEKRVVQSLKVLRAYGAMWSAEQIVSVARMQLKEYAAKAVIRSMGYNEIPEETRPMYDATNQGFALWCTAGAHSFDPADVDRKRLVVTEYDEDGQAQDRTVLTCGEHARQNGLINRKPIAEIPYKPPTDKDDALYIEFLEWKNGMTPHD